MTPLPLTDLPDPKVVQVLPAPLTRLSFCCTSLYL